MAIFNMIVLSFLLKKRLGRIVDSGFLNYVLKVCFSGIFMALTIIFCKQFFEDIRIYEQVNLLIPVICQLLLGIFSYAIVWSFFNRSFMGQALSYFRPRITI